MSGGLFALLDDIAVLARAAAASVDDVAAAAGRASAKAAGVIVDDTAVTPRYVDGLDPARELPIIKKIAKGSLINKLVFILPLALLLRNWLWTIAVDVRENYAIMAINAAEAKSAAASQAAVAAAMPEPALAAPAAAAGSDQGEDA